MCSKTSLILASVLCIICYFSEALGPDGWFAEDVDESEDLSLSETFGAFMARFNKTYATETEREYRFQVFKKNLKMIDYMTENEEGTAEYGITRFTDLIEEEFRSQFLGYNAPLGMTDAVSYAEIPNIEAPAEVDWRKKGVVTDVKNQGQCGSCWSFSATGNMEGQYAIKHQKLVSLSEQQIVDCDKTSNGCKGGNPIFAYQYVKNIGGIELENDYSYTAKDGTCHANKQLFKVQVENSTKLSEDETEIAKWLAVHGPVSVALNANPLNSYKGGIIQQSTKSCSPEALDHAVLLVGYGVEGGIPYWLVKNSWGADWGEEGYFKLYRGAGTCGINLDATSSVVV